LHLEEGAKVLALYRGNEEGSWFAATIKRWSVSKQMWHIVWKDKDPLDTYKAPEEMIAPKANEWRLGGLRKDQLSDPKSESGSGSDHSVEVMAVETKQKVVVKQEPGIEPAGFHGVVVSVGQSMGI
jgi:hypothetical protein